MPYLTLSTCNLEQKRLENSRIPRIPQNAIATHLSGPRDGERKNSGTHSVMACIGAIAGLPVIGDCAGQPAVRRFIHGLMTEEVGPHQRRPNWLAYRDALARVTHWLAQINRRGVLAALALCNA